MLVLAPTRELAGQVHKDFDDISAKSLLTVCIYGGTPYQPQGINYKTLVITNGNNDKNIFF